MEGWIKLYREIQKHWIFEKPEYLKAWIVILMDVNHEPKKVLIHGVLIDCNRGQSLNSLKTWSNILNKKWTIQKVRTFFKLLEKDSMIAIEGLQKTTRLTVCNYGDYQNSQHTDNTQPTHR